VDPTAPSGAALGVLVLLVLGAARRRG